MTRIRRVIAGIVCGLALAGGAQGLWAASLVNVNSATAEELARLPGIGPALAQAIVKQRAQEPFAKLEDLSKVKGIGTKLVDKLRDQITVGDVPAPKGRGS